MFEPVDLEVPVHLNWTSDSLHPSYKALLPQGTTVHKNGTAVLANGTIIELPKDPKALLETLLPEGAQTLDNGTVILANGTAIHMPVIKPPKPTGPCRIRLKPGQQNLLKYTL